MEKLTKKDIVRSIEFSWMKHCILIYIVIITIAIAIPFFYFLYTIEEKEILLDFVWFPIITICIPCLYDSIRMVYILLLYKKFDVAKVKLEKCRTTVFFEHSLYFIVNVGAYTLKTSPIFSNAPLSKYHPEDFQGMTVLGLVNKKRNRFYIIKRVFER